MPVNPGSTLQVLKAAFSDFGEDEAAVRAAALAYYTVFALPPLLIILMTIAGLVWDPRDVREALTSQFAGMMGEDGAGQVETIIAQADRPGTGGLFATIASIAGLLFGATGAFIQMQAALNRAWGVKPDPRKGGVMQFIMKRVLSLGMVLGIGFLLAVSLALTSAVAAVGSALGGGLQGPLFEAVNFALSLGVLTLLFAAMFKVLPDAEVAWSDVWIGGAVTALLFTIGKFAIGFYLGRSSPGDPFGAAGALAVVLIWTYYAGMIVLFGAEFTQQWVKRRGRGIEPEAGAVRVVETERHIRPGEPGARAGGGAPTSGDRAAAPESRSGGDPRPEAEPYRRERVGFGQALLGVPIFLALTRRGKRKSDP